MNTTDPSSTHVSTAQIDAKLTEEERALLDKVDKNAQAYRSWCANLRPTRTQNIESVITDYYQRHQLALEAVPLCHRTQMLLARLQRAFHHGEISSIPSEKLIRRVIQRLAP